MERIKSVNGGTTVHRYVHYDTHLYGEDESICAFEISEVNSFFHWSKRIKWRGEVAADEICIRFRCSPNFFFITILWQNLENQAQERCKFLVNIVTPCLYQPSAFTLPLPCLHPSSCPLMHLNFLSKCFSNAVSICICRFYGNTYKYIEMYQSYGYISVHQACRTRAPNCL